jgi:hypothetical protein
MTVDYGKTIREMDVYVLQRFLAVCALVSDLDCPGFNPRQSLAKHSNLARTAARYKVDVTKVAADVRAELARSRDKKDNGKPKAKAPVEPNYCRSDRAALSDAALFFSGISAGASSRSTSRIQACSKSLLVCPIGLGRP